MDKSRLRAALLGWYDAHARVLPWRSGPAARAKGAFGDPYRVWVSEVMLQQTTAAAVAPRFHEFVEKFPNVAALAAAPAEAVMQAWAGLGYYSRARNLHTAAKQLAAGGYPSDEEGWRALPGVGPYTAAAIAAISFDRPANVVDGNVERVVARLFRIETPMPAAKAAIRERAASLVAAERAGDWPQALMDLGATICTPRRPACPACPIARWCAAAKAGDAERFPVKAKKALRPERFGVTFWLERDGEVLLTRRPPKGLLGGMLALPSTPWRDAQWTEAEAKAHAPAHAAWRHVGEIRHVFTHFALTLAIWRGSSRNAADGQWMARDGVAEAGLPSVFRKVALKASGAHP